MASKVKENTEETEQDRVYKNRMIWIKELLGEEFPEEQILELAISHIERSDIKYLLDRGCPPKLITKILL